MAIINTAVISIPIAPIAIGGREIFNSRKVNSFDLHNCKDFSPAKSGIEMTSEYMD
ncbi:MAG: hypothetical protein IH947_11225 [Bacteroidetes bacterium]|nr:hypothetical protein [Bacteroidota bacterium]MCH8232663.1 hypothetical protein [Bacteroidota bacterium]